MFRFPARFPAARVLTLLPLLAVVSCGSDTGAVITVPNSVVVADLQHNGVLDVVLASAQIDETGLTTKPGLMGVIMNSASSPGTFAGIVNYDSSSAPPSGLAVGDLTGTGTQDIVVANLNAGTLSVFMETSATSGTYGAPTTIAVGGEPNDVQMVDLNGDGLPDLIVADNLGKVTYLLQDKSAPGTFLPGVSMTLSNPSIVAEGLVTRGISVAAGDLNGDGLPDLAVTTFDQYGDYGMVFIFFQDPNSPGTFIQTPKTIETPGEPSQIRIADMTKNGVNDLVIACQGLGSNADAAAAAGTTALAEAVEGAMVILNSTTEPGTFGNPIVYAAYTGVLSLSIGDLNNDGYPDIALSSLYPEGTGYVITMIQSTTAVGTFLTGTDYEGLGQPSSIVIGDMNNDGLNDLVTADSTSANWYKNQSSAPGTFVSQGQIGL